MYDSEQNVGSIDFKILLCTFCYSFKCYGRTNNKFYKTSLLPRVCLKLNTNSCIYWKYPILNQSKKMQKKNCIKSMSIMWSIEIQ